MKLEDLKQIIENKEHINQFIIFIYSDTDFVPMQYIKSYSEYTNKEIIYINDIKQFSSQVSFLTDYSIYVYRCDKFETKSDRYKDINNLFVICKDIDDDARAIYENNIVTVPKLEKWQIYDYIKFNCPTLADKFKFMINSYDMYAIDNEISKISIFSKNANDISSASAIERDLPKYVYQSLIDEGCINYISKYTLYDFVQYLILSDVSKVSEILNYDIQLDPMELYYLLYSTVKQIISVVIDKTSSAESLGMKSGQYWAIKYTYNNITKERITYLLRFLDEINKMIITNRINKRNLLDYIIINFLKRY